MLPLSTPGGARPGKEALDLRGTSAVAHPPQAKDKRSALKAERHLNKNWEWGDHGRRGKPGQGEH